MPFLGLLGLGRIGRWITLALCAGAFWAGTEMQHALMVNRCLEAGGTIDARGLCHGLR
ncbi:MAG: hypothetical protein AAF566_00100 [Pseudomonadota bacterium]